VSAPFAACVLAESEFFVGPAAGRWGGGCAVAKTFAVEEVPEGWKVPEPSVN